MFAPTLCSPRCSGSRSTERDAADPHARARTGGVGALIPAFGQFVVGGKSSSG